jgi:hypothetical protein
MSKETTKNVVDTTIPATDDQAMAYLVKLEDGYHIEDLDGNIGEVCKFSKDGTRIMFTPNASNRKETMVKVAEPFFAKNPDGKIALTYKATRVLGEGAYSTKLPNEKLISYLPEAEQEEYRAIIARAIAARDAEKNRPLTEREKAEKALEAAKAKLAKLEAELAALNA